MTNLVDTGFQREDIVRETDKAVAVVVANGATGINPDRWVWLPKSQIIWQVPANSCFAESIHVPAWLARKIKI